MKRKLFLAMLIIFSVSFFFSCGDDDTKYSNGNTVIGKEKEKEKEEEKGKEEENPEILIDDSSKIVLAYVTSWSSIIPNPNYVTHINYAFGHVNKTFNGIIIDNEARLRRIVELKKEKPSLNVILSIGGWESGGFSEMAMTESRRKSFAVDCKRVIDNFGLDGIDIDWEFPTSSAAGISSSPKDKENFSLLMRAIRESIGNNKILTFASPGVPVYYHLIILKDIVNFVNIMMYDNDCAPYHHSALHQSNKVRDISADEAINNHIVSGMPVEKLVLGIPFYGRGKGWTSVEYKDIYKLLNQGNIEKWDDVAKVPYLENPAGETILVYDNARSIGFKCEYLLQQGLRGAMYWEYSQDDSDGTLRKAVWNGIMK